MTTVICDFMGDQYLEDLASKLCVDAPKRFSHLISHRVPKVSSPLAGLYFIDATKLYHPDTARDAFPNISPCTVSQDDALRLMDCQTLFLSAMDRTLPNPISVHELKRFFWELISIYMGFFDNNKEVDSVIFDNTPHLPWDIAFFFVARIRGIKVLFMRRTGLRGYLYIDENFMPGNGNWKYQYKGLFSPIHESIKNDLSIETLNELSFTRGQVNGMWSIGRKSEGIFRRSILFLRKHGFHRLIALTKVILTSPPNNFERASGTTGQRTVLAGAGRVGRLGFLLIHLKYIKLLKACQFAYSSTVNEKIDLNVKFIYFAMHFQPERTTMPEGFIYDDQMLAISTIAEALPEGWKLYVKEHPRQMSYDIRSMHARSPRDYANLLGRKNVELVPTSIKQSKLIDCCKITATISGSVSWEGLIKGKPSLIFSDNWHAECESTQYVTSVEQVKLAISKLEKKTTDEVVNDACNHLRKIYKSLIYGALNQNHLQMFFEENERYLSVENMSSALIQRLSEE